MSLRIYVFAPYRNPEPSVVALNILRAVEVGERLAKAGYDDVFVPHLYHFWDAKYEHPHEFWMKKCLMEVKRSDVLVGAGLTSEGCKAEIEEARIWNHPVYMTVDDFLEEMVAMKEIARTHLGIGG